MKKIKICISNFGHHQLWCLDKLVSEYNNFKNYTKDITVYTNVEVPYKHKLYDSNIGMNLPFTCREDLANSVDDFDLFLYSENDILISEDNILAWEEAKEKFETPLTCGFYRYELLDNQKVFVDINKCLGTYIKKKEPGVFASNLHQGCFLLNKEELKYCIYSGEFVHGTGRGPYETLEQGASDPYNKCGLKKLYPNDINLIKRLGIIHLPSKYSLNPHWVNGTYNEGSFVIAH